MIAIEIHPAVEQATGITNDMRVGRPCPSDKSASYNITTRLSLDPERNNADRKSTESKDAEFGILYVQRLAEDLI